MRSAARSTVWGMRVYRFVEHCARMSCLHTGLGFRYDVFKQDYSTGDIGQYTKVINNV